MKYISNQKTREENREQKINPRKLTKRKKYIGNMGTRTTFRRATFDRVTGRTEPTDSHKQPCAFILPRAITGETPAAVPKAKDPNLRHQTNTTFFLSYCKIRSKVISTKIYCTNNMEYMLYLELMK